MSWQIAPESETCCCGVRCGLGVCGAWCSATSASGRASVVEPRAMRRRVVCENDSTNGTGWCLVVDQTRLGDELDDEARGPTSVATLRYLCARWREDEEAGGTTYVARM
mgnify:FL=1